MLKLARKITTVSLAACVLVSAFAGCQKTEENTGAAGTTAVQSTQEEKKPTLRVLNIWMKDDYNTYPVAKAIEEKTGYHVEYEMLPQDKPEDKLNLFISSGEPYDLITFSGNMTLYSNYAKMGALRELTPLIEKYGPNVKAAISDQTNKGLLIDGKLYGIGNRGIELASTSLLVRQDWLDKIGMKMPTTTDEFVEMLKQFKEKDPGGNGAQMNIPFTAKTDMYATRVPGVPNLTGAFGMTTGWDEINGKLVPQILNPGFKNYISFMSDLYKQGLIDSEFPINKEQTMREKFTSGRAGVIPLSWFDVPTITTTLLKNNPNAKCTYMPALKGKDGSIGLHGTCGLDKLSYIPTASKNAEHTMKWINAKLDKDTFKLIAIGEEGKHYTYKDGAYAPILPIFNDERNQANNYMTGIDEKLYPDYWQARVRKDMKLFDAWNAINNKEAKKNIKTAILGVAPYLPNQTKNDESLKTMVNDYMAKLVIGSESISTYDGFVEKWKAAGGDASIKDVDEWYAGFKK